VARVKDFGVFVTTEEGLDGLVRAGDLSWSQRVANPADLYKPGDEVEAVVLELEPAKERMALGIKQLNEDPWEVFAKQTPAGSRVTGKVTRIADFGVFVELAPGIEGLCHISQLAEERVQKATEVTNVGQDLEVMVLEIDRDKRRIGLSVKALSDDTGDYRTYEKEQKASESVFGNFFGDALAQKLARDKEAEAAKEPTSADSKD
jgi:small subunit ribosomal protein S1